MRRRQVEPELPPEELWVYVEQRWGDVDAWGDARRTWAETHGWPGGPVARLQQQRAVKRRLARRGRP